MLDLLLLLLILSAAAAAALLYRQVREQERRVERHVARERTLKAQFDDVFERTADAVVLHDRHGRVTTMNRTSEQLSGYPREEVRTLDPDWLFSDRYLDVIRRMLAEGPDALPRTVRAEIVTKRSTRVPIEAHARVLTADGQVTGVSVIARDMTERDQLEQQLRQAQKMEAVGRLATGIAHDFNNLITVLLGCSEELADHVPRDSPLRRTVDEVRRAAERASGLTQQLLSFSRRQVSVAQPLDLNATVANMQDLLRRLLGAEITLDVRLGRDLGLVSADPVQIGQVVMNLAVNARDAMPNGGTLTIETSMVTLGAEHLDVLPGPHVLLAVRDTGVGISQDVQRRLFEPFFTTKDAGQGTGLGLSMVHAIVRQSGGDIAVESAIGAGTTFRVYLPAVARDAAVSVAAADTGPATGRGTPERQGTGVVLLAEDDRAVRRLLSGELRRRGFTVLEARDGREALDIVRHYDGRIHLLLTDIVMPNMNGSQLVAEATPLRPEMAVLCMSGHPERAGVGVDAEITQSPAMILKPFTPDAVVARVHEALMEKGASL